MKTTILLLFLIICPYSYGQNASYTLQYTVDFYGDPTCPVSQILPSNYSCTFNGNTVWNDDYDPITGYDLNNLTVFPNLPVNLNQTSFDLTFSCQCEDEVLYNNPPRSERVFQYSIENGIKNGWGGDFTSMICPIKFYNASLQPNNLKITNNSTTEIVCSGEALNLSAGPEGFPSYVYHWQYSYDNQPWQDVPLFNDNKMFNKSIKELFGEELSNTLIDKTISFRLGYWQNKPLTTSVEIKYSRCTPAVTNLEYIKPNCSDQKGSVLITFDRELFTDEELRYVKLIKKGDTDLKNYLSTQPILSSFIGTTYTFKDIPSELSDGSEYYFTYQAYIGSGDSGIAKGFWDSPSKTFSFVKVMPLKFEIPISSIINTSCYNSSDGSLVLNVTGGTPKSTGLKYNYFIDEHLASNVTEELGVNFGEIKATISGLSGKKYDIKITDTNGCIEIPKI